MDSTKLRRSLLTAATVFLLLPGNLLAQEPAMDAIFEGTEPASLKLTPAHFAALGDALTRKFQEAPLVVPLSRHDMVVPLIARGYAEEMVATIRFAKIAVRPTSAGLRLNLVIDDIRVEIGRLRMESYVLPFLGSSCTGAELRLGGSADLRAGASLDVTLRGDSVAIGMRSFDFKLPRDQYESRGPTRCRGGFIIGDLFTQVVSNMVLEHSKWFVEAAVEKEARDFAKSIESMLNALTKMDFPVNVPQIVVLPASRASVGLSPQSLEIEPNGLAMQLALRVRSLTDAGEADDRQNTTVGTGVLAAVKVPSSLVNEILQFVLNEGRMSFEATADLHEIFAAFKDPFQMENFLPDLRGLAQEELRVFVEPVIAPTFATDPQTNALFLSCPQVRMRFQISREGDWLDYFLINLSIHFGLEPVDAGDNLALRVVPGEAHVSGEFAEGYTPQDPTFHADDMAAFFNALMQVLAITGEPFLVEKPILPIAGFSFVPGSLVVREQAVEVEVKEAEISP